MMKALVALGDGGGVAGVHRFVAADAVEADRRVSDAGEAGGARGAAGDVAADRGGQVPADGWTVDAAAVPGIACGARLPAAPGVAPAPAVAPARACARARRAGAVDAALRVGPGVRHGLRGVGAQGEAHARDGVHRGRGGALLPGAPGVAARAAAAVLRGRVRRVLAVGRVLVTGREGSGEGARTMSCWRAGGGRSIRSWSRRCRRSRRRSGSGSAGNTGARSALVVFEAAPVELKPFSLVPDTNGDVTIEGRLDGDAAYFAGYANQGRFGVEACLVDPGIPRPQFRVTCHMAPEDATAWLADRLRAAAQCAGASDRSRRWRGATPRRRSSSRSSRTGRRSRSRMRRRLGRAVVAGLNMARAAAGLQPVRLADVQSGTAARVARQYFAAALGKAGLGDTSPGAIDADQHDRAGAAGGVAGGGDDSRRHVRFGARAAHARRGALAGHGAGDAASGGRR